MNAESHGHDLTSSLTPLAEENTSIPPFVKTIAVRLSWACSLEEVDVYRQLSAPWYQGVVTEEDKQQLLVHFPFMAPLHAPASVADYTIMLVSLWLNIEEMYHRGTLLPEELMQGLIKKSATSQAQDCRHNRDSVAASAPRR
ncbi:hypothetical protein AW40_14880 [Kosakonia radicincitans UMEnt01/12]|uniref:hypothetical protein n=1 Tax=Kosakonia radicincitans TaxID=283686 RepID=UPI000460D436|nr:hypothetical protein [Kosakonia radicincitans]KDE35571.1 hypothetical protein AW40_14880 [Kosakonia radicincitans UMEnt01/12]